MALTQTIALILTMASTLTLPLILAAGVSAILSLRAGLAEELSASFLPLEPASPLARAAVDEAPNSRHVFLY